MTHGHEGEEEGKWGPHLGYEQIKRKKKEKKKKKRKMRKGQVGRIGEKGKEVSQGIRFRG